MGKSDPPLPRLPNPNAQTEAVEPADQAAPPPKPRRRRRKIAGIFVLVVCILLGGTVVGGAWLYYRLSGNVQTISVETAPAPEANEPVNILLMGSDSRTGKGNKGYGLDAGRDGERSDTTILLHISADRQNATAVSIPRDTWVRQPACASGGVAGVYDKFNSAFQQGGASCTTEVVTELTGVPIHHVAVVDFAGFKNVIDAMGGVEVCLNQPIQDPDSQLDLPAGTTLVDGERALAFVRARKTLGDGSDIGRIARQQAFLSSAIRKATDTELLLNPVKLFQVLDTATQSLTVDESLNSLGQMRTLVDSLRAIEPANITFVTMPFTYRADNANVDVDTVQADKIWQSIINDTPWPPSVSRGPDGKKVVVGPEEITVRIVDASGSLAGEKAARQLRALGFSISEITQANKERSQTEVTYGAGLADSARTVAYVSDAPMKQKDDVWTTTLVVGSDWSSVKSDVVVGKSKNNNDESSTEATTAAEPICAN
ncbi:LCP family protein [Candidatus Nanopelagicales bacterium]|nr:LCP family protein [Candidatus Nanopelagicales bacterium]